MSLQPITIPLKEPITDDGTEHKTITLREIKVGDLCTIEALNLTGMAEWCATVALLSGLAVPAIRTLSMPDYATISHKGAAHLGNDVDQYLASEDSGDPVGNAGAEQAA